MAAGVALKVKSRFVGEERRSPSLQRGEHDEMRRLAPRGLTRILAPRPEIIDGRQRASPLRCCEEETLPLGRYLPEHFCPSAPARALAGFDGTPTEGKFGPA
jgi:hypothetical protein